MTIYQSKHVAQILPCVIKTFMLTYKSVLQYIFKHFMMSSLKLIYCKSKNLFSAFATLRKVTITFVMSVRPSVRLSAQSNSAPTGRIFSKFTFEYSSKNCTDCFKCLSDQTGITVTLNEDQYTIFYRIWLNSSWNEKVFRQQLQKKPKHILFKTFFQKSYRL